MPLRSNVKVEKKAKTKAELTAIVEEGRGIWRPGEVTVTTKEQVEEAFGGGAKKKAAATDDDNTDAKGADLNALTVADLRERAGTAGISGASGMNKAELIAALESAASAQ